MVNFFKNKFKYYKCFKKFIFAISVIIWFYSFLHWLFWNCLLIAIIINLCSQSPIIVQLPLVFIIILIYILITIFYFYFWKFFIDYNRKETDKKKNLILSVSSIVAFYLCFILTLFVFFLMLFSGH